MNTFLDHWTEICQKLFKSNEAVHPIHSCIVSGKRHYIHAPDLPKKDPLFFDLLKSYAFNHDITLKADKRKFENCESDCRRRKLLPIIFLSLGLNSNPLFADQRQTTSLNLLNATDEISTIIREDYTSTHTAVTLPSNPEVARSIEKILLDHYIKAESDPTSMRDEIYQLAIYYAAHPEAEKLITKIADEDWTLHYAPHTFQTDVIGTRLNIEDVRVYFDPRSGAKLKFYDKCAKKKPFCIASPADALLHELLHVQAIRLESFSFISQGGLNNQIYPSAHERHTIIRENILYKSMSLRDKKPRPIRSEHTGRHVLVSCVTCIE